IYAGRLLKEGVVSQEEVDAWQGEFNSFLDVEFDAGKAFKVNKADWLDGEWAGLSPPKDDDRRGATDVRMDRLRELGRAITKIPREFDMHKTVQRVVETRRKAI